MENDGSTWRRCHRFSALLRAEIPKSDSTTPTASQAQPVSVLFYEPKFPKCDDERCRHPAARGFSALLRAEIPKMHRHLYRDCRVCAFQCSSTSRNSQKVLLVVEIVEFSGFSALLRAEIPKTASRVTLVIVTSRFSALLRAEIPKSSACRTCRNIAPVSVLFYEPKFPKVYVRPDGGARELEFQCSSTSRNSQNLLTSQRSTEFARVSVLFYEPKFPKGHARRAVGRALRFQCSSTSRNSQNVARFPRPAYAIAFQCSSTSRNSQNMHIVTSAQSHRMFQCSSTSRNSQNGCHGCTRRTRASFSALLRAEIPKTP